MKVVCHTHSDCFDVLDLFLKRYEQFCPYPLTILTNKEIDGRDCFIYNETDTYKDRWIKYLKTIDEDICLVHEDFILYDHVNLNIDIKDYDCIRLQMNGNLSYENDYGDIYKIVGCVDRFSITPSIWKSKSLLSFYEMCESFGIWDIETNEQSKTNNMKIGFVYSNENKVGMFHYRSKYFPCILSAISKGKWNYNEYKADLDFLFESFSVDNNIRYGQSFNGRGEFYVAPVYNEAIKDKKIFRIYDVERMIGLGTPEDLERYKDELG